MFLQRSLFNKLKSAKFSMGLSKTVTRAMSGGYYNHRPLRDNQEQTPFEFTEENYKEVKRIWPDWKGPLGYLWYISRQYMGSLGKKSRNYDYKFTSFPNNNNPNNYRPNTIFFVFANQFA